MKPIGTAGQQSWTWGGLVQRGVWRDIEEKEGKKHKTYIKISFNLFLSLNSQAKREGPSLKEWPACQQRPHNVTAQVPRLLSLGHGLPSITIVIASWSVSSTGCYFLPCLFIFPTFKIPNQLPRSFRLFFFCFSQFTWWVRLVSFFVPVLVYYDSFFAI